LLDLLDAPVLQAGGKAATLPGENRQPVSERVVQRLDVCSDSLQNVRLDTFIAESGGGNDRQNEQNG
jgi:hypothetical protein